MCTHVSKNRLFSALLLANILLSVICCLLFEFKCLQCGLLHPPSCTDRAIHAFPGKTQAPGYFLLSFNGTSHPLCYWYWLCASANVSVLFMRVHVCKSTSGSASVRLLKLTSACSAEHQQLQYSMSKRHQLKQALQCMCFISRLYVSKIVMRVITCSGSDCI